MATPLTIPTPSPMSLRGVIGFNGGVPNGVVLSPDDEYMYYPLGSTIIRKHLKTNTQTFLQSADTSSHHPVSAIALSPSGRLLAVGHATDLGFTADIRVWDLSTNSILYTLTLHKGKVQDLAFSPTERYLASLGARDDNKLVIWDLTTGEAICGAPAHNESAFIVRFTHNHDFTLISAGNFNIRIWTFDVNNRKLKPNDCKLGQIKRSIQTVALTLDDQMLYAGTTTGDILSISVPHYLYKGPSSSPNKPFIQGVTAIALTSTKEGHLICGTGDGTVALLDPNTNKILRKQSFDGRINSITFNQNKDHFFIGTNKCNLYCVRYIDFAYELRQTAHNSRINQITYAKNYSDLFATCSASDIRIWNTNTFGELLRITVPNTECQCIVFSPDGKAIISGWTDGSIRAFKPITGALLWTIHDAHTGGVSVLVALNHSNRLLSGGENGCVRVWSYTKTSQTLLSSMKEHKQRINSLSITADDSECVSASSDGSCIVWSLQRYVRLSCLFASTQFRTVTYHPDQSQLLTGGSDRKLTWWDHHEAQPIRVLDGSKSDGIDTISISTSGHAFACGGGDRTVKVFGYEAGVCEYHGYGHSAPLTAVAVSPNTSHIVSGSDEGAIFVWNMPHIRTAEQFISDKLATATLTSSTNKNNEESKEQEIATLTRKISTTTAIVKK